MNAKTTASGWPPGWLEEASETADPLSQSADSGPGDPWAADSVLSRWTLVDGDIPSWPKQSPPRPHRLIGCGFPAKRVNPLAQHVVESTCGRCGAVGHYTDIPVHDGRSLRRECDCGRVLGFPVWYESSKFEGTRK